ncbi:MAG: hypothetical protein HOQ34_15170, partial [Gemmatimonadaceae bacterium]|nr:hypothetical protein [Gemmatimonadaceae bacterium]
MTGSKRLVVVAATFAISALFACERAGRASEAKTAKTSNASNTDTVPPRPPIVPERCATMPASWTDAVTPARLKPRPDTARAAAAADSSAARDTGTAAA